MTRTGNRGLDWVRTAIEMVDRHLDEAAPQWAKDCPEANMQRRVGKAQLEAAEAMEELSLLTGENPRKGQHSEARDRMLAELGDTAVAALLGIQSQVKDTRLAWGIFTEALAKAYRRVPDEHRHVIPPEQDRAWREMVSLGEELQDGDPS